MRKLYFIPLTFVALSWALWSGCAKNDLNNLELAEHSAEFAVPLLQTNLEVSDLVQNILEENNDNDTLIINADNTITLIYSGDVTEKKATDIFNFFQNIPAPVDSSYSELLVQAPDGVSLQKADLSGGTIAVVIRNTMTEKITGTFRFPSITNSAGQIYSTTFSIDPGQIFFSPQINLEGWHLDAQDNIVYFEYDAYLPDGTQVLKLPATGGFPAVVVTMQNITFYYMEGYWGKVTYPLSTDTINIDINQSNLTGNVIVKNPKVTITVFNSYGFPTRGLIKYLRFRGRDGQLLELESPLIQVGTETGIDFAYPSFQAGEVGQTKETSFYFDETNSNIADIFNAQPTQMIYEVEGLANANADPSLIGFLTDSSTVRMNVKVELLLEGQMQNFAANQTVALDFGDLAAETLFDTAEFKLVTENRIPFGSKLQLYFQDVNDVVLDSLFTGGAREIIHSAPVNTATGIANGMTRTETFIPFTGQRFERLRQQAKKAHIEMAFTTAEDGNVPVKILVNQGCDIKMGVRIKKTIE